MSSDEIAVILKSFDAPDEVRVMEKVVSNWCISAG